MQKFCEFISRKILILRLFLCVHFRFKYQDGQNDLFEICQKHFDTLAAHFFGCKIRGLAKGGDEARSGYIRYVQGKQPNLPCTYFNSSIMQLKCLYANPSCTYQRTSQLCTTSDLLSTAPGRFSTTVEVFFPSQISSLVNVRDAECPLHPHILDSLSITRSN